MTIRHRLKRLEHAAAERDAAAMARLTPVERACQLADLFLRAAERRRVAERRRDRDAVVEKLESIRQTVTDSDGDPAERERVAQDFLAQIRTELLPTVKERLATLRQRQ